MVLGASHGTCCNQFAPSASACGIEGVCSRFNVDVKAAALQFCLAHPRVAAIIPGGANLEQTLENKGLVDAAIPGGLWRGLKEVGCVRGDAPTPGNADGRL